LNNKNLILVFFIIFIFDSSSDAHEETLRIIQTQNQTKLSPFFLVENSNNKGIEKLNLMKTHFEYYQNAHDDKNLDNLTKINVWQDFLNVHSENYEFSHEDEKMRSIAHDKINALKKIIAENIKLNQKNFAESDEYWTLDFWLKNIPNITNPDTVLLTQEEIDEFNISIQKRIRDIFSDNPVTENFILVDIDNYDFSQLNRKNLLLSIKALSPLIIQKFIDIENGKLLPSEDYKKGYYYHNDRDEKPFSKNDYTTIVSNMNLHEIPEEYNSDKIEYGIIIEIADLRSVPYSKAARKIDSVHDRFQETQIDHNELVAILHEGKNDFLFVQTGFYRGWIDKRKVAIIKQNRKKLYESYNNDKFVVITDPILEVHIENGKSIPVRMGTKLQYLGENNNEYKVGVSCRNSKGEWTPRMGRIIKDEEAIVASAGYLTYNVRNLLKQMLLWNEAITDYSWGKVDCSEFVRLVFKTFGIDLPRNSGQQSQVAGIIFEINNKNITHEISLRFIRKLPPGSILGWPGHVSLLLGSDENDPVIIQNVSFLVWKNKRTAINRIDIGPLSGLSLSGKKSFLTKYEFAIIPYPYNVKSENKQIQKVFDGFK